MQFPWLAKFPRLPETPMSVVNWAGLNVRRMEEATISFFRGLISIRSIRWFVRTTVLENWGCGHARDTLHNIPTLRFIATRNQFIKRRGEVSPSLSLPTPRTHLAYFPQNRKKIVQKGSVTIRVTYVDLKVVHFMPTWATQICRAQRHMLRITCSTTIFN